MILNGYVEVSNELSNIKNLEKLKSIGKDARCLSIAQTELETSCMYAVKSLFA